MASNDEDGALPEGLVSLSSLTIPQLDSLNKQLNEEVEFFGESLEELRSVVQKFQNSRESVERLKSDRVEGSEILVPLTTMMYVPGKLTDNKNVLIELGTGYYVELPTDDALGYFNRRIEYVSKQIESVQGILQDKTKMVTVVSETLRSKVEEHLRSQQRPD